MLAVAEELRRVAPGLRIVFVGTERGIESQVVPESGYELRLVSLKPLRGGGALGALRGLRHGLARIQQRYLGGICSVVHRRTGYQCAH